MTTSTHTQHTLKLIAGHLSALQDANRSGDPRFAADVLADIRQQARTTAGEKTRTALDKLAEQLAEQQARTQQQLTALDATATAADLVRRGQVWDRVERLLDAAGTEAGVKLHEVMGDIATHLPGHDPVVVLQAILENGPVYAAALAQRVPGLPQPTEIVEQVHAQLAEQGGPIGETYRARVTADADARLVDSARSLTGALSEGHSPDYSDMVQLYEADQSLYELVSKVAPGYESA